MITQPALGSHLSFLTHHHDKPRMCSPCLTLPSPLTSNLLPSSMKSPPFISVYLGPSPPVPLAVSHPSSHHFWSDLLAFSSYNHFFHLICTLSEIYSYHAISILRNFRDFAFSKLLKASWLLSRPACCCLRVPCPRTPARHPAPLPVDAYHSSEPHLNRHSLSKAFSHSSFSL